MLGLIRQYQRSLIIVPIDLEEEERERQRWAYQAKIRKENREAKLRHLPDFKRKIVKFLGRNSFLYGRNLGKAFNSKEIIEGLGIKDESDSPEVEAVNKILDYFKQNKDNPEGIFCMQRPWKYSVNDDFSFTTDYYYKKK
jgi:hypothetical protein